MLPPHCNVFNITCISSHIMTWHITFYIDIFFYITKEQIISFKLKITICSSTQKVWDKNWGITPCQTIVEFTFQANLARLWAAPLHCLIQKLMLHSWKPTIKALMSWKIFPKGEREASGCSNSFITNWKLDSISRWLNLRGIDNCKPL